MILNSRLVVFNKINLCRRPNTRLRSRPGGPKARPYSIVARVVRRGGLYALPCGARFERNSV